MPAAVVTRTEAIAATLTIFLVSAITASWGLDLVGLAFSPWRVLPLALAVTVLVLWRVWQRARPDGAIVAGWLVVTGGSLAWLLSLAWPSLLPIGGGDLTHHLQLVDYLERHWRLVHDPSVEAYLGEMVHYTPGVHLLAALAGRWFGSDGLHMTHPVVALSLALKAGFVYLIAVRLLAVDGRPSRAWLALVAPLLLLIPHAYVLDGFLKDSFLAQVMSEMFAVAMWWALVAWHDAPSRRTMGLFAAFAIGAFLTWPIWIGPPCVALGLLLAFRRAPAFATRVQHGLVAVGPLAIVGGVYLAGRVSQLAMAGAAGAVLRPTLRTSGPELLVLALLGIGLGLAGVVGTRLRPTLFLAAGIALQAGVLYAQAMAQHNASAYMTFKTLYLAPYPLAVMALVPLAAIVGVLDSRPRLWRWASHAVMIALVVMAAADGVVRVQSVRRPPAAVTQPVLEAGIWAREHLPRGCVAYLVVDDDTSYWLHLAVLRNPRMSERTADLNTFLLGPTVMQWFATEPGLPYAIADLPALARGVREDLDVIERFGTAAVVKRRGPTQCAYEGLAPAP